MSGGAIAPAVEARSSLAPLRDPALLALLGMVATLPLARPSLLSLGASSLQVTDVLLGSAWVAWAIRAARGRAPARPDLILVAGTVFVLVLAGSVLASPTGTAGSVAKLTAYGGYVLLPWLMVQLLNDPERLAWAVGAWLIGTLVAVGIALGGILSFAIDPDALTSLGCVYGRLPAGPYPRVCIPFRNPNLFANYLTASGPLLLACGGFLLHRRWARRAAVSGTVLAAVSTLSTGIGGFGLAMSLTSARTRGTDPRRDAVRAVLVAMGIVAAVGFAAATVGRVVPAGRGHVPLGEAEFHFLRGPRVHTWLTAAATVREHPVLGTGYGTLVARTPGRDLSRWFAMDLLAPFREPGQRVADAHNTWLSVAAQGGLLGLAAFVVLLVVLWRRISFRPAPSLGRLAGLPPAAAAGIVGALLFHGLFASAEEFRHLWPLFGLAQAAHALPAGEAATRGTTPASSARRPPSR